MMPSKVINYRGIELVVLQYPDGLWRDNKGCIYGFPDSADSVDPVVRLGIGVFSLPTTDPLTPAAVAHDHAYTNDAYQRFHPRSEADNLLKDQLQELSKGTWRDILARPFYNIARWCGGPFWEYGPTRDK